MYKQQQNMYTINPLEAITVSHMGFYLVCFCYAVIIFGALTSYDESFVFISTIIMVISYNVSYNWTSQESKVFKNEQVIGKFMGFYAGGPNKIENNFGLYASFEVNGEVVILTIDRGISYPKTVILYKN